MGLGRGRDAQHCARRSGKSEGSIRWRNLTNGLRGFGRNVSLHFADTHLHGAKGTSSQESPYPKLWGNVCVQGLWSRPPW